MKVRRARRVVSAAGGSPFEHGRVRGSSQPHWWPAPSTNRVVPVGGVIGLLGTNPCTPVGGDTSHVFLGAALLVWGVDLGR